MNPFEHCARLEEKLGMLQTPEKRLKAAVSYLCSAFRVQPDEIAVFTGARHLDQEVLCFLWPPHLAASASGYVPLSSEGSLAVRTFLENKGFINLTFASTRHSSYFEILPADRESRRRPPPIQKIISAPARQEGGFQGVIQVSHKGASPEEAGPDFGPDDLDLLVHLAAVIAAHL
jgi:GAF domain-containing protein